MIIRFLASLREITGDTETAIQLEKANINVVLEILTGLYGEGFREAVFDSGGELSVKILINGRNIDYLDGLNSKVSGNDTIHLFPPIAGGNCARL